MSTTATIPSPELLLKVIALQTDIAKLGHDLGAVMSLVVARSPALINADGAVIELVDHDEMVYRAASGLAKHQVGMRIKKSGSIAGLCVATGETLRCDDSETDPRVNRAACRQVGLRSMIVIPLKHNNVIVGVFKVMSSQPGKFTTTDMFVVGLTAELIAAAMFYAAKYDSDELFYQATHDSLTGLANRALFMDRLHAEIAQSQRDNSFTAILILDMNDLKLINDNFGHRAGDAALCELALRLKASTRSSDLVARLSGDEYAVLLKPVTGPEYVETVIERIYNSLRAPLKFADTTLPLSASIGAACFPADHQEIEQLIEIADQRMYSEKRQHHASNKNINLEHNNSTLN